MWISWTAQNIDNFVGNRQFGAKNNFKNNKKINFKKIISAMILASNEVCK